MYGCPNTPAPWTQQLQTLVRLSNNNGSSHKGESHGREEDYGPVLSRKNSLKTASMGESELQSGGRRTTTSTTSTKKSGSKSSKKHETEEEKEERLKEEKEEKKLAAKIAKREAEALERVHETVADLPVIKEKKTDGAYLPRPGKRSTTPKTTDDFDAGAPSADKEEVEALKERLALLSQVSSKKSSRGHH